MNTQDIQELFDLQNVLAQACGSVDADIVTAPEVLAALLDWKNVGQVIETVYPDPGTDAAPGVVTKTKRGKLTESTDSEQKFEPTPDPSADDPGF